MSQGDLPSDRYFRGIRESWLQWSPELEYVLIQDRAFMLRPGYERGLTVLRDCPSLCLKDKINSFLVCFVELDYNSIFELGLSVAGKQEEGEEGDEIIGLPWDRDTESESRVVSYEDMTVDATMAVDLANKLNSVWTWAIRPSDELVEKAKKKYERKMRRPS